MPVILIDASEEVLLCLGDEAEGEGVCIQPVPQTFSRMAPRQLEKHLMVTQAAADGILSRCQWTENMLVRSSNSVTLAFVLRGVLAPVYWATGLGVRPPVKGRR